VYFTYTSKEKKCLRLVSSRRAFCLCLHSFLILEVGISARFSLKQKITNHLQFNNQKIYCSKSLEVDIIVDITDKETKAKSERLSNFKVTQLTNGRERIWKQTYLIVNSVSYQKLENFVGKNLTKIEHLSYKKQTSVSHK